MANPTSPALFTAPTSAPPNSNQGKTAINDAVVAKVAGIAAREVSRVHALGGGAARALGAIRDALNTANVSEGISVEVGKTQVAADITIVAEYPVALQDVAERVRAAVIGVIEDLVGREVTEVNVNINDVYLPADDKAEARVQRALQRKEGPYSGPFWA